MAYRTDPALKITRGDGGDYGRYTFTVTVNGSPVNVTGRTFYLTAKRALSDVLPVFQLSTARGDFDYTNAATGVIRAEIRPLDTALLSADTSLYCDLQVSDSSGVLTLDKFMLPIELDVTEVYN